MLAGYFKLTTNRCLYDLHSRTKLPEPPTTILTEEIKLFYESLAWKSIRSCAK